MPAIGDLLRVVARRLLPAPFRRRLRELVSDLPVRLRDLPADVVDAVGAGRRRVPLPPASLRRGVGRSSSRREYAEVGRRAAADLLAVAREVSAESLVLGPWLDFGCGSGRVARHLLAAGVGELWGVDVDAVAVVWAHRNLRPGRFEVIGTEPPSGLPEAYFSVVSAVSVFTHFDARQERAWLAEVRRLLAPGGLLLATTHGPDLVWSRPDLDEEAKAALERDGHLFAPGAGRFNDNSAFHARGYLERRWGEQLELVSFEPHGLAGFQDLSVWRLR